MHKEQTANAQNQTEQLACKIGGLDCPNCARALAENIQKLSGVEMAEINFQTETLKLKGTLDQQEVYARIHDLGYEVLKEEKQKGEKTEPSAQLSFWRFLYQKPESRRVLLAFLLILPGLVMGEILGREHFLLEFLAVIAMLLAGVPVFKDAWKALRRTREVNMNVLMSAAAVGAVIIGTYVEAGMIMVLFAIGEMLEQFSSERTRRVIRSLFDVLPPKATRVRGEGKNQIYEDILLEELQPGDRILVKPGEAIPMDGRIISGSSLIDQSPVTGESRLVVKEPRDDVLAGSINGEGALEISVERLLVDNTISRMIKLVEEAQEHKANTQRFIDRFAKYYTPLIVVLAALTILIPTVFLGRPLLNSADGTFGWLYRGLAVLIVGCPCALVISTPVSIISAISRAARAGVLIKGGVHLETLSKVNAVAFDKTGTLTLGKPKVVRIQSMGCLADHQDNKYCENCRELISKAAAVEMNSEHPLAGAILEKVEEMDLKRFLTPARNVQALAGQGIIGELEDHQMIIASHRYFDAGIPHDQEFCRLANIESQNGNTPLLISEDGDFKGFITVADTSRPESKEALLEMRELGISKMVMLSGDQNGAAQKIGKHLGLSEIKAELLPEEKLQQIEMLQKEHIVAMIGDGINDAPALARADVGIAIGGALGGTAQAVETADITLMSGSLKRLPFVLRLSKAAMRTIKFNIAFALLVKLFFFVLVLLGSGTMWMAVLADTGTTLLVTLFGMRLLNWGEVE